MTTALNKKEKLLWMLLYSNKFFYEINIEEYCNTENRADFRDEIRNAVKRGGVTIVEDRIIHREENVIWKIEIRR